MSSVHGKLKGKKWSVWTEELGPGSPPGDTGRGGSSRVASPMPPTEDVMKLPKEDMHTYGQCPIWDRFILVTCEKCSRKVKLEALESHVTLRHGSKSERSAYHKELAARASSALKACQVKLTPMNRVVVDTEEKKTYPPPDALVSGSSSSTSPLPVSYPSTPPQFHVSSPSPLPTPTPPLSAPSLQPADTRSPSPELMATDPPGEVVAEDDMEVDSAENVVENDVEMQELLQPNPNPSSVATKGPPVAEQAAPHTAVNGINFVAEEADSTTHNVISIPDSDEIPNIEIGIISEGQVLDSINTKYNVSILKTDSSVDSTTPLQKPLQRPPPAQILPTMSQPKPIIHMTAECRSPLLSAPPTPSHTPPRISSLRPTFQPQLPNQEKLEAEHHPSAAPTHYITVSPLSKGSPKKPVIIKAALEKKPSGREREYDPNKHCGVWDADAKRNCTRSLTCKSHSVYLKRKVINRSGPFDELLAAHKAEKEASLKIAESSSNNSTVETEPTSILARRLQLNPANSHKIWEQTESAKQSSVLKSSVTKRNLLNQSVIPRDNYCDENLHYTTDHPKPLAVCTFGGKRIGGLFIADRSRFLTRKVMKIAISTTGIQRIQPALRTDGVKRVAGLVSAPVTSRQQSLPYIVNLQGGGAAVSRVGVSTAPRVGTIQIANNGLQTQHFLVQDAFKTDIQDFKGGMKFELGRNIHHVLPSTDTGGNG